MEKQEDGDMTATAIQLDLDLLNELFDNQKKLDAILDDDFFGSTMSFGDTETSSENDKLHIIDYDSKEDSPFHLDDTLYEQKSHSMFSVIVPVVLEIAAIIYGLMYFSNL